MAFKETKRKGFNFFRSYFDVYNELENDKDRISFIGALLNRQFLGIKPENLKGMAKFAYISQVNSIDSQVKGFEDKTGLILTPCQPPTAPPTEGGSITPSLQVEGEVEGKVEEKREKFSPPSLIEVTEYFFENGYTKEAGKKAFEYYDCANWKDSKGNRVKSWKQKMRGVWFKVENKQIETRSNNAHLFMS